MLTQFARYRWQDHVPQPGRWKTDLVLTALFVGTLYALGSCPQAEQSKSPVSPDSTTARIAAGPQLETVSSRPMVRPG